MKLRPLLLTILLITGIGLQNCSNCNSDDVPEYFDINDVELIHWDTNADPLVNTSIPFNDYGFLNLQFLVDYIGHQSKRKFSFLWMNSLYACSPERPGYQGSKEESIESLEVITINDFDEDHSAGTSINDLFELHRSGESPMLLEDFLNSFTENVPDDRFLLRLLKKPTTTEFFEVKLILSLSTGENYEVTAPTINIY